ncbi:MAG: Mut7-C RNAse domain-containing protein [Nitrospirae bacterium]|nr:Mut7-C RNAse domain-containing protein [Nitrospirota bacterium]
MKFIADSMLGRLARWLRLLGYDTLYYPRIDDRELLRIAREDERVLLTRDTRLVKARGLKNFLLLTDNDSFKQLGEVISVLGLKVNDKLKDGVSALSLSRCAVCNARLAAVRKEEAKAFVPEYVFQTSEAFRKCSGCGKLYWNGTHPEKFREKLKEILQHKNGI